MVFLPPEAKSLVTVTNQTVARVLNSQFKTQRVDIDVEAAEPSLVVVAQTYYHDWRVYVDDQPAQLLRANYAFQAFQVSGGGIMCGWFMKTGCFYSARRSRFAWW